MMISDLVVVVDKEGKANDDIEVNGTKDNAGYDVNNTSDADVSASTSEIEDNRDSDKY